MKSKSVSMRAPLRTPRGATTGAGATTEDIVAARSYSAPRQREEAKISSTLHPTHFDKVSDEFLDAVEADTTKINEEEEDRLVSIERWVQRIERSLVTEQERRVEMYALLQDNVQRQFDALNHRTAEHFKLLDPAEAIRDHFGSEHGMVARVGLLHERLRVAEKDLEEEVIRTHELIRIERERLLKMIDDFDANLEVEKFERLEREAHMLKKVVDECYGWSQVVDEERARRETVLGHIRDEQDVINTLRDKPDAIFKDAMMKRMVACTRGIKVETVRREAYQKQFVQSLEGYAKGVEVGLRLVNLKPRQASYLEPPSRKSSRPGSTAGSIKSETPREY